MENKDQLRIFLKELPQEEPSANFTRSVMDQIRVEKQKANIIYKPLISKQLWWKIFAGIALSLASLLVFFIYEPSVQVSGEFKILAKADLTFLLRPFLMLSEAVNKLTFTSLAIVMSLGALLLIDQLMTKFASRRM
jgi:hypothetical protein